MRKHKLLTALLILGLTMVPVKAAGLQTLKHMLASLEKFGDENIMTSDQYDNRYQPALESLKALVNSSDENTPAATTINRKAFVRPDIIMKDDLSLPLSYEERYKLELEWERERLVEIFQKSFEESIEKLKEGRRQAL
mgnify:CR=1 FL=1